MEPKNTLSLDFNIIGIGASAGGLDAINQLFDKIPANSGAAYVIVQHLSPDFKSLMPELLAKHTSMEIINAEDDMEVRPNCVYLNQRNNNLTIVGKRLKLSEQIPKKNLNLPIDIFFHTLGDQCKEKGIGIILSGTGSDGSRGIKTIKESGGIILVQDPNTAQFDGMPNSAISTNLSDFIVPINNMADLLLNIIGMNPDKINDPIHLSSNELVLDKILEIIHKHSGIDFKRYKKNTLVRRIEKRMNIHHIDLISDYYVLINNNPEEKEILKQDFLIGVTSFFRDQEAFEILSREIIPKIVLPKKTNETVRVWIPGCSTGEEVYSIAIILDEYIRKNSIGLDYKIFATDIDTHSLAVASAGVYKSNIIHEIERSYLEKYFVKTGDSLTIIKRIREKIVFSNHDLLKDPPFIRMDLISCRNLLIYLDNTIQKKILYNFHFALNKDSFLFLGSSESLGELANSFKVIDAKWKIFQSESEASKIPQYLSNFDLKHSYQSNKQKYPLEETFTKKPTYGITAENFNNYLSKKFSPASIFIDSNFKILYIKGDAGLKLNHKEGVFQNNLLKIIPTQLAVAIRAGVRKIEKEQVEVIIKDVPYERNGENFSIDVRLEKIENEESLNNTYVLFFGNDKSLKTSEPIIINDYTLDNIQKERLVDLEEELLKTKSELQNVVEELETSNEELQSSNEELMASNEELQSTNEELQSVNEELHTVNTELQEKNKELAILNDDINNLLDNSDIGILFLDNDLKIRKFTPALRNFFHLEFTDIGRTISSFASEFSDQLGKFVIEKSQKVLKNLALIEEEIGDSNGNYTLVRILPFVTKDKTIDGVIISFININEIKKKEDLLKQTRNELEIAQNIAALGSWYLDINSNEVHWSKSLFDIFGLKNMDLAPPFEVHSQFFTKESWATLNPSIEKAMTEGTEYEHELEIIKSNGEKGWIWVSGKGEKDSTGKIWRIRGIAQDITIRKKLNLELQNQTKFANKMNELSPVGVHIYDIKSKFKIYQNSRFEEIFEPGPEDTNILDEFFNRVHPEDKEKLKRYIEELVSSKTTSSIEFRIAEVENSYKWIYSIDTPFEQNANGELVSVMGIILDITDIKRTEENLNRAIHEAEKANSYKNQFLANMSHEIRTPINGILGFSSLLEQENIDPADRKRYSQIISNNSKQLLTLINDIIDLAKLEAGELRIKMEPISLDLLMNDIYESFTQEINIRNKNSIKLVKIIPSNLTNTKYLFDANRLRQIMGNLITNSIKFTDQGSIEIGYSVNQQLVTFFVKDQGIGIPEDKLDHIYERFVQLESTNSTKIPEGTGLGLSIVQGLVHLLNGTIEIKSKIGLGTEIKITFPIKEVSIKEAEPKKETKKTTFFTNKKILIVEDNISNIDFFKAIFLGVDCDFKYAESGREAIDYYLKEPDFDLILMDMRMPDMDGVTAAKEIWKHNPNMKIIAQTAFAMYNDEFKYKELGFADYISKPFSKSELFQIIEKNL